MLRSNHYDLAFAEYLQSRKAGYIAVDEHRRAQLAEESLKSLDFIVSVPGKKHLLIDVKGRSKTPKPSVKSAHRKTLVLSATHEFAQASEFEPASTDIFAGTSRYRLPADNWVMTEDIQGLTLWQQQFGADFLPAFIFAHVIPSEKSWLLQDSSLQNSTVNYKQQLYLFWLITLQEYSLYMQFRSPRWQTWWLKQADFRRLAKPISQFI